MRETAPTESFRSETVRSRFDLPPGQPLRFEIEAKVPDTGIGAIVGPSGSGKTLIAEALYGGTPALEWHADTILDDMPEGSQMDDIIGTLTAVGLSSIPAWLQPYGTLSTGQQFRAMIARRILETEPETRVVIDEYTSVVDRQVARAVSVALGKHARRVGSNLTVVSCHTDFLEWLQPDWVFYTDTRELKE